MGDAALETASLSIFVTSMLLEKSSDEKDAFPGGGGGGAVEGGSGSTKLSGTSP